MQDIGELCDSCKEHWTKAKKPLKKLERAAGLSLIHKLIVPLCPYCDGDAVLITQMGHHDIDNI